MCEFALSKQRAQQVTWIIRHLLATQTRSAYGTYSTTRTTEKVVSEPRDDSLDDARERKGVVSVTASGRGRSYWPAACTLPKSWAS